MNDIKNIVNLNELTTIIESAADKMVFVLFFHKTAARGKLAYYNLENCALSHLTSIFVAIQVDRTTGESRFVNTTKLAITPAIEAYYRGNFIGRVDNNTVEKEIQQIVRYYERQMMVIGQDAGYYPPPRIPGRPDARYSQRQPIQHPAYEMPALNTNLPAPDPNTIPTMQQLRQYFDIFLKLQQMGALVTEKPPEPEGEKIHLKNGDVIVVLGGGKYGLIKKK